MLKMQIDNEEVVSKNDFTIKEEMLSASSTILNNTYPKSWEDDKDYINRFYYPKDYAKLNIQNFTTIQEYEAGTTVEINGSATLTDVDSQKNSRVLSLKGQTSQQTYTGKNKVDGANPTDYNIATSTFDNDIIKVSSTTTSTTPYARWVIEGLSNNDVVRYSGIIMNTNGQIALQYDNNGSWATITASVKGYSDGTTPTTYSWTNSVNTTKIRFLLCANKVVPTGASESSYKNVILTINNSDLSYEPYVGGVPSPNPQFPQPVNVVSGDNYINICGKNKLSPTSDFETTHNSVTFKGNNGVYTIKGTATGGSASISKTLLTKEYTIKNGDYLHLGNATVSASTSISYYFTDNTSDYKTFNSANRIVDMSSYVGKTLNGISFWVANNLQVDLTIMPMILNTSTATTYEPYIGNTYPIYLGVENLLNYGAFTTYGTTTITDETISVKNNTTSSISGISLILTGNLQAGTYTFTNYSTSNGGVYVMFSSSDYSHSISAGNSYTFTYDGTSYLRILGGNINVGDTKIYQLQLEKGSKANHYTPYGTTPIELCKIGTYQDMIYKGKGYNLLENTNTTQTINGITFTKNDNGSVKLSGTSNAVADYYLKGSASDYVDLDLPSGSYNLSGCINGSGSTYMLYVVQNRNGSLTYLQSINTTGLNITIQNGDTFRIFIRVMSGQTPNTTISPMINEGSTPLPYEPYNAENKWLLHKEIGKYIFNGSENFTAFNYGTNSWRLQGVISSLVNDSIICIKSNIFTGISKNDRNQEISNSIYIEGSNVFTIRNTSYTTKEQVQSTTNGNYIYYILDTPTTTEITNTELINQLDALESS